MAPLAMRYSEAILNTKSLFPWPFVTLTAIEHLATQQRVSQLNVFSSHSEYHGEVPLCLRFLLQFCMMDWILGSWSWYRWGVKNNFVIRIKRSVHFLSSVQW